MSSVERKAKELREHLNEIVHQFKLVESFCATTIISELSILEIKVIAFIGQHEPVIMKEIAEHLMVAMSTATGIVDKLVQKEFAQRERTEEDRRVVRVELTGKGREVYNDHATIHLKLCRSMLRALDEEEQESFMALMQKIAHAAKQQAMQMKVSHKH